MRALNRLRVLVLLNTSAGTIERQGDTTLRQVLMSAFDKHGISAVMEFLPGAQLRSAAEQTRQRVVLGELDAIVVGGGDGSRAAWLGNWPGRSLVTKAALGG